jgi:hypothetical protein
MVRGKPVKTAIGDRSAPGSLYQVNCQLHTPATNILWLSRFTYAATRVGFGFGNDSAFVVEA